MKTFFFHIFLLFTATVNAAIIKGSIIDVETHKTVPNAAVSITGKNVIVISDAGGKYIFNNIQNGTYTIMATCMGYKNSVPQQINVTTSDAIINYDFYLKPSTLVFNEVVVKGSRNKETDVSARYDEKVAPNVINIISAKTIEALPDLNVADVMQRVSGVSMLKNSSGSNTQMIIRGMPPRFNSAFVNGVTIPSPSTSNRSASLDIFGSDIVGRIEVIKALTPDLEGDGIGGSVNIIMKQAPDTAFINVQVSTGYSQYYFNHDFLTFDSKSVAKKDFYEQYGGSYIPNLSDFSRKNLVINSEPASPDLNGSISLGRRFFKKRLGVMVTGDVQTLYLASTSDYIDVSNDAYNKMQINYWEHQVYCKVQKRYGAYIKLDYKFNENNQITFYNSFFQLNENRAREVIDTMNENGRTIPGTGTVHTYSQTVTDNSGLETAVLKGNHKLLKKFDLDWTIGYSSANSNSPDYASVYLTQTISTPNANAPKYLNYAKGIVRVWQWDVDENEFGYLNINYKPTILKHLFEFKVGGMARNKFRKNYANEYDFDATANNNLYPNPDILTVPISVKNNQQLQGNAIDNSGNYRAWEDVQAAYGMVNTTFGKLQILTGIRVEFTYMENEHNQVDPQMPVAHARFSYYDPLPSIHLNYKINDKQNLRFSAYEAINRPNYTEVIPYSDIRPGGSTGNPKLRHTIGNCYDLRYEMYPRNEEVFTAGLFYKRLKNAIEELVNPGTESKSLQNVPLCTNYGIELVGMKYFGDFGISANYTFTHSSVVVPKHFNIIDTNLTVTTITKMETRPLVGQSPHLINASITYRNNKLSLKFSVVYTMQGAHVINVNDAYGKDEYQKNYHNLGVSLEKTVYKKLNIVLKVSNILNYPVKCYTKDGTFIEKLNNYQRYFIGLKYTI